jgi:uncharacterized membrane protein
MPTTARSETTTARQPGQPRRAARRLLRTTFLGGLVILVPILITVKALSWLFTTLDGLARPAAIALTGQELPGLGVGLTVGVVFLAGLLFSVGPLRRLHQGVEGLVDELPLVGTVYGTTKKVLSGFGGGGGQSAFQRFVLARLPGRTTPGFLTGGFALRRRDGTSQRLCMVYVPTNHLYVGDVVVLPPEDVVETDLSVEQGVGLLLSAGASVPATVGERTSA